MTKKQTTIQTYPLDNLNRGSVVEGVIQYQIPIDDNLITKLRQEHLEHLSLPDHKLSELWINHCVTALWRHSKVITEKRFGHIYDQGGYSIEEVTIDLESHLSTAHKLGIVTEEVAASLIETATATAADPIRLITTNALLLSGFWGTHYIDYHLHFLEGGAYYGILTKEQTDNASAKLLKMDPESAKYDDVVNLVQTSIGNSAQYSKIKKRIESISMHIDGEFIDTYSPESIKSSLIRMARKDKYLAPGFEGQEVDSLKFINMAALKEANKPEVIVEALVAVTSFPGKTGKGNILKTHSLFPGEKAIVTVETFQKEASTYSLTSSILDSASRQAEDQLSLEVGFEQSFNRENTRTSSYSVGVDAKASWGWGSAGAKYSQSGSAKNVAKKSVKNVRNAITKQSDKVSKNRSVKVDTSATTTRKVTTRESIVRTIENINVSSPLNFVFMQMNQAFLSLTTVRDLRIVTRASIIDNGNVAVLQQFPDSFREYLLDPSQDISDADMNAIYDKVIETAMQIAETDEVSSPPDFIIDDPDINDPVIPRKMVNPDLENEYEFDQSVNTSNPRALRVANNSCHLFNQTALPYEGVLLDTSINTLNTEAVYVECYLSESEGLDQYSKYLQLESIEYKQLNNELLKSRLAHVNAALSLVEEEKDPAKKAELYEKLVIPLWKAMRDGGSGEPNE